MENVFRMRLRVRRRARRVYLFKAKQTKGFKSCHIRNLDQGWDFEVFQTGP
jgi:hypothetical protein